MGVWYATREAVMDAVDFAETSRADARIDRALEAASRDADRLCGRRLGGFWPEVRTRRFDWPDRRHPTPWRLWVGEPELVELTSLTAGGTAVSTGSLITYPDGGPPFDRIEVDRSTTAELLLGDTAQNDVSVVGVWGYDDVTESAGELATSVASTTATTVDVTDGTIGVGDLLTIGSERVLVTGRANLDTTQNVGGSGLTASSASVALTVSDGTAFTVGETLTIESERVRVEDIAGNVLTVRRAFDGSVLAAHAAGVDIYARRRLTVTRGALGTTAATHSATDPVVRQVWPGVLVQYVTAAAIAALQAESAGMGREAGAGERRQDVSGSGLDALAARLVEALGRGPRHEAV